MNCTVEATEDTGLGLGQPMGTAQVLARFKDKITVGKGDEAKVGQLYTDMSLRKTSSSFLVTPSLLYHRTLSSIITDPMTH